MKNRLALAAALAAAAASVANAEFAVGNEVSVSGWASGGNAGSTTWGTVAGQGLHDLGFQTTFWDSVWGPNYPVIVTSTVVNPWSVEFNINFTGFFPADFAEHEIVISGLKYDDSIMGVQGNSNGFQLTDTGVAWFGSGAELSLLGTLSFKVVQVPAPGAIALVGLAGLASGRRRRA